MLTLKDVVAINQEFDRGTLVNESSLDFALTSMRRTTNWQKGLAYMVRAILVDHVFEDGNKRTAAALILTEVYIRGFTVDKDKVARLVERVLLQNITSIRKLEEMVKDVIQ